MGVRIEWAEIGSVHVVTEEDDIRDEHGTTLDPGNVGIAAEGCIIEGSREAVAARCEELAAELRGDPDGQAALRARLAELAAVWERRAADARERSGVDSELGYSNSEEAEDAGAADAWAEAAAALRRVLAGKPAEEPEHAALSDGTLLRDVTVGEVGTGAILASVVECPECHTAVLTAYGEGVDGCVSHTRGSTT